METFVEEHPFAVLISVAVSFFFSLIGYASVCAEQSACLKAGTCFKATNSTFGCSFRTVVTPAAWRLLNMSNEDAALASTLRGVCAPGLRQNVDPVFGTIECTRLRSYPGAMNTEIMTNEDTPHRRYCGAWIDAGRQSVGETKFAFFDADAVERDVHRVLSARSSSRVGTSAVSRFRSSCRSMVATNAQGPAGEEAFQHLAKSLHAGSLDDALESVGFLASHYCDAPAQLSLAFSSANVAVLQTSAGIELSPDALDSVLYAVGDDGTTRQSARDFALAMDSIPALDVPEIDQATATRVAVGSHRGTWLDSHVSSSYTVSRDLVNVPLGRFRKTAIALPTAATRAYLRGLAAHCAFATRGVVTGDFGMATSARPDLIRATALGRLEAAEGERLERVHAGHFRNASKITWSSLQRSSVMSGSRSQARAVCLEAAQKAFPDAFDADAFDVLVPDALYDRLEGLTADVRSSVFAQLDGHFASFFTYTSTMRGLVGSATVRIAGAPRGTWAGLAEQRVEVEFGAHDGALLMLLKQGRTVFLNRMLKIVNRDDICSHPPLYAATERNAYLLVSESYACAMLLPGIVVPPFAHVEYDDESLRSRIGYVIAHELSHVTALQNYWQDDQMKELLYLYADSTYVEAIADLMGVAAIRDLGVANETLCGHVSQLWCARQGLFVSETTHPRGNLRGDNMCSFLS